MQQFEASVLQLPPGIQVSKIVAGLGNILLLDSTGALWVMGDNKRGQLGAAKEGVDIKAFTRVEFSDPVQDVQTGINFTLALTSLVIRKGRGFWNGAQQLLPIHSAPEKPKRQA